MAATWENSCSRSIAQHFSGLFVAALRMIEALTAVVYPLIVGLSPIVILLSKPLPSVVGSEHSNRSSHGWNDDMGGRMEEWMRQVASAMPQCLNVRLRWRVWGDNVIEQLSERLC